MEGGAPIAGVPFAAHRLPHHNSAMDWLKYGLAIGGCLFAIACRDEQPIEAAANIRYRLDQHMAAASKWCGVGDWRALFSANVVGEQVRLAWRIPASAGQPHPRADEGRCILGTFGAVTATDNYFEVPRSASRARISASSID
jgi:hypothetical protein